jgi:hypothetical protein
LNSSRSDALTTVIAGTAGLPLFFALAARRQLGRGQRARD